MPTERIIGTAFVPTATKAMTAQKTIWVKVYPPGSRFMTFLLNGLKGCGRLGIWPGRPPRSMAASIDRVSHSLGYPALGLEPLAHIRQVPRRNVEELAYLTHHLLLSVREFAVGINNAPHHLDKYHLLT